MAFGNTANEEKTGGKKPVNVEKVGGISVSTWENSSEKGGKFYTMTLQRCYKDGEEFKYTGNLRVNDIPKAILALQKTYEKAVVGESKDE